MDEHLRSSNSREEIMDVMDDILNDIEVTEFNSQQINNNLENIQASVPTPRDSNHGHVTVREVSEFALNDIAELEQITAENNFTRNGVMRGILVTPLYSNSQEFQLPTVRRNVSIVIRDIREEPLNFEVQPFLGSYMQSGNGSVIRHEVSEHSLNSEERLLHRSALQNGYVQIRQVNNLPLNLENNAVHDSQRILPSQIARISQRLFNIGHNVQNHRLLPAENVSGSVPEGSLSCAANCVFHDRVLPTSLSDDVVSCDRDGISFTSQSSSESDSSDDLQFVLSDNSGDAVCNQPADSPLRSERCSSDSSESAAISPFRRLHHSHSQGPTSFKSAQLSVECGEPPNVPRRHSRTGNTMNCTITQRLSARYRQTNLHGAANQVRRKYAKLRQRRRIDLRRNNFSMPSTSRDVEVIRISDDESNNSKDSCVSTIAAARVKQKYENLRRRNRALPDIVNASRSSNELPASSSARTALKSDDSDLSDDGDSVSCSGDFLRTTIASKKIVRTLHKIRHTTERRSKSSRVGSMPSTIRCAQREFDRPESDKVENDYSSKYGCCGPSSSGRQKAENCDDVQDVLRDELVQTRTSSAGAISNSRVYSPLPSSSSKRKAETHEVIELSDDEMSSPSYTPPSTPPPPLPPRPQRFPLIFPRRPKRQRISNDDLFVKRLTPCDELRFLARDLHFKWITLAQAKQRMEEIFNRVDRRENFWSVTHLEYSYESLVKTCSEDSALQVTYMLLNDEEESNMAGDDKEMSSEIEVETGELQNDEQVDVAMDSDVEV